ncbi:MAG: hypothetical protein EBQ92_06820 [Proteobacteria bacterium]|jgi:hypothetical protein|nr:hypothetical protein [Pseudomonadota bacterium]
MKLISFSLLATLIFGFSVSPSFVLADEQPTKVSVLPSTDSSTFNLGAPLQQALARLYKEAGTYSPTTSDEELSGFTPLEISRTIRKNNMDALSFALLEQERISVFLFDKNHPLEFIVSSKNFTDAPRTGITSAFIESKFRSAFNEVVVYHREEKYQELPGARTEKLADASKRTVRDPRIADESRVLFRELSSLTDSNAYIGASLGMSRFGSEGTSASTVTFGLSAGYQIKPRVSIEGGLSASTYLIGSIGGRYALPFKEEFIKLSVGLDVASVLFSITQNYGYGSPNLTYNSPPLTRGTFFVGPGIFFDIPLLGATLRGDLRFYTGTGTIIVGTYGLVYYL